MSSACSRAFPPISRGSNRAPDSRQAYSTVRIALPAAEVARLKDIRLVPGIPAEAFIQTQIARTFRER
jgi:hypothetical protein